MTDFSECVKTHFHFLETKYDCKLQSSNTEDWGGEVVYLNQTTGIKLLYEFSSAFIFVFIYRLVNGKMVDNPRPVTEDSIIYCFDFNDALPESEKMKPAYEYDVSSDYFDDVNGISNYTRDFASRLETYGDDVLSGDFSILSKMERIIKERASCSRT